MNNLKKVLLTGTITIVTLFTMSIASKAATVKVTGDVINVRKEASIDSTVVAKLSKDVECEYLGEEGDWYKVKYQNYTGYVSKQYTELVGEVSENTENSNEEGTEQSNNNEQAASQANNEASSQNAEQNNDNQLENNTDTETNIDSQLGDNAQLETTQLVYKTFNQNTIIRILPLIHSSNIGEAKKNDEVLILTETSGWSYIQTDEISGWVRTDTLGEAKTVSVGASDQDNENNTSAERIGYISEDDVNMRKGAGTSYSVLKVLALNTQVTILEEDGNWYKVKSGNTTGYVSKDYVSDSKTVTSRSLSEPRTEKENIENEATAENAATSDKTIEENTNTVATTNKTTTSTDKTTSTTKTATESNKTTSTTVGTSSETNTTTTSKSETTSSDTIKGTDVIAYAKKFLGYKYVWAGDGSNGTFDCSGFTMYVYNHFGVSLPHYTVSQYNSSKGTKITNQSNLQMGDIVFLTDYETGAPCGHCGIYISNGDFIHADSSVGYVNISNLNGIYKGRFCGALRIF